MLPLRSVIALGGVFLCAVSLAWGQTSIDAAYYQGRVEELPEKKLGKLDASDPEILRFTWDKGNWKVLYSEIKTIYVSLSRRSVLGEAFGLSGAALGAAKKRKLLLSLVVADRPDRTRNAVFYLPIGATREFMQALTKKSGRTVVYESYEARQGAGED
jgi:hypothetical protein